MKNRKLIIAGMFALMVLALSACAMGPRAVGTPGLTADGDMVYVSYQQYVYAVNAKTGQEVWRYPAEANAKVVFYAPPLVTEDAVYVGDLANALHKINKTTGANIWTFSEAKGWFIGQAGEGEGVVYAPSSDRKVYAIKVTDGSQLWAFEAEHQNWSQPLVVDGLVVFASMDHFVYALNSIGEQVWSTELNGASVASPIYDESNQQIVISTIGNSLYALNSKNGKVNWMFDQTKSSLWATPLQVDDVIYISDEAGSMYAVAASNGKSVWTTEIGSKVMAGLLAFDDGFIAVTEDGSIKAFDFDRNAKWTRSIDAEIYTTPVKTSENLIIATIGGDALLYGFDLQGNQVWSYTPGK